MSDQDRTDQQGRADRFRALHHRDRPLVLPNVWDVAGARIVEDAGAAAVATTSGGVAWSLGVPDGGRLGREPALEHLARIVAAVEIPVTADIEDGYAADAAGVAETVRGVLATGAVGINLEDGDPAGPAPLRAAGEQAERIAAARAVADAAGVALFLNARIDVFLFGVGEPQGRTAETLRRAEAYVAAGADGVFVPGVVDPETVTALAKELAVPLNVMAGPGAPPVPDLAAAGAGRISLGTALPQAAYAVLRRGVDEVLTEGSYRALEDGLDYGVLNALHAR